MDNEQILTLERLFLALADRTRLRLLSLMADGEVSVGFLSSALGESQPKTSRHLAYLRNAGLVDTRRDGKWIYYFMKSESSGPAAGVLNAILNREMPQAGVPSVAGQNSEAGQGETYADTHMSEFRPNEIEVFLL